MTDPDQPSNYTLFGYARGNTIGLNASVTWTPLLHPAVAQSGELAVYKTMVHELGHNLGISGLGNDSTYPLALRGEMIHSGSSAMACMEKDGVMIPLLVLCHSVVYRSLRLWC